MSDEQLDMANDFFADSNGIVNDSEGMSDNATSESISDAPVSQPVNPQQQNAVNQNQAAANQPAVAPDNGQTQKPAFEAESPESMLFNLDDRGNATFDVNKAMELAKTDTKVFEGVNDPRIVAEQAPQTKEPELPEWQKRLTEQREAEQTMLQNLTLHKNYLREAIANGYSGQAAFDYADAKINEIVRMQSERSREEYYARREEERERKIAEREEMLQYDSRAKTNIAAVDRELGGNFEKLTIGYVKDGKYVPGIAANDINKLFEKMNPDAMKNPSTLKQSYENWWKKMNANEADCRWLANIARLRLLEKSIPRLLEAQRSISSAQSGRMKEGISKSPSNIQHTPAATASQDNFDSWINAAPGNRVDLIG